MNNKLKAEAKAFDKIVTQRSAKNFNYDLNTKKIFKFFYNNPWRYPDTRNIAFNEKINFIKKNIKKNCKILEVGCGTGFLSIELVKSGHNVTGIDISKKSINIGIKTALNKLTKGQLKNLNFKNISYDEIVKYKNKYDAVIFFKTLHHLENTNKVIKNTNEILNKNGKIIIIEPLRNDISKINIAFALIARTLANTWENRRKKIIKNTKIENAFNELFKEYRYIKSKKGFDQSPNDNTIGSSKEVIKFVSKFFKIKKLEKKDVFKDKLIGGVRGKERKNEVRFISLLDDYLIKKKIATGSTLMLVGIKLND
jgi:2-polyprenyl-3-methyl-5-hydroxy-6-metoxy-1,4-benzoquinol methylase